MHTKPMADSEGTFQDEKPREVPCPKCGSKRVVQKQWESNCGGYEDLKVWCQDCGWTKWYEGPDA